MKKRSMLAIASLATGFVVAAVTPSHAAGDLPAGLGKTTKALGSVDLAGDVLTPDDKDDKPKH
jgi:hypothetical protein